MEAKRDLPSGWSVTRSEYIRFVEDYKNAGLAPLPPREQLVVSEKQTEAPVDPPGLSQSSEFQNVVFGSLVYIGILGLIGFIIVWAAGEPPRRNDREQREYERMQEQEYYDSYRGLVVPGNY